MNDAVDDLVAELSAQVKIAAAEKTPVNITGSASKAFYGRAVRAEQNLNTAAYRGIVSYDPTELVITARAGTPLRELEAELAQQGQMLGFEPPYFGADATLGGTIACGLSGPRRPYTGSARDFVLGIKMINGRGEILSFGGQVIKNVAGYDVSRLLTGSLGTLGIILEVSLKVLPLAAEERTLIHRCSEAEAIERFNTWANRPYPISAAAADGEHLYLRLSGAASAVAAAAEHLGGEPLGNDAAFWQSLREQNHPFFTADTSNLPLWRLSLPPATAPLGLPGPTLLDWGGAQRWLYTDLPAEAIFAAAKAVGGHAVLFRGGDRQGQVFQPLDPVMLRLHQNLKQSFDPDGIFNSGRLYAEF